MFQLTSALMLLAVTWLFPCLWVLSLPLSWSFYGIETVVRMSLHMLLSTSISQLPNVLAKYSVNFLSSILIKLAALALMLSLPVGSIPLGVVWIYDKILWILEPVWMVVEVVEVVLFVMAFSQFLVARITDNSLLYKGIIIFLSAVSYILSIKMYLNIFMYAASSLIQGLAICVLVLSVVTLAYACVSEDGVISDSAMISTLCAFALTSMYEELDLSYNASKTPHSFLKVPDVSFMQLIFKTFQQMIGSMKQVQHLWLQVISVMFIFQAILRLFAVMSFIHRLELWKNEENDDESLLINDDDDDVDLESSLSVAWRYVPWRSSWKMKMIFVFVFTQMVTNLIHRSASFEGQDSMWFDWLFWGIIPGRILQILLALGLYLYRLSSPEDDYKGTW